MTDLTSLVEGADRGLNTLLLTPSLNDATTEAHHALLSTETPAETSILFITYRKMPDTLISEHRDQPEGEFKHVGVISLGDKMRRSQQSSEMTDSAWIEILHDPGDLTGLGIRYNRFLDAWERSEGPLVVCFDSLTALLQYVDEETAFRFVQLATSQFQAAGAITHFHLDSEAHSAETEATFKTLFDAVIEISDGSVTVQRG